MQTLDIALFIGCFAAALATLAYCAHLKDRFARRSVHYDDIRSRMNIYGFIVTVVTIGWLIGWYHYDGPTGLYGISLTALLGVFSILIVMGARQHHSQVRSLSLPSAW